MPEAPDDEGLERDCRSAESPQFLDQPIVIEENGEILPCKVSLTPHNDLSMSRGD